MATDATAHALPYRHCVATDLFKITDGDDPKAVKLVAEINEYLKQFAAPVKDADDKAVCFHCGKRLDSFSHAFRIGAAYEWGLAHGEARCSGCKWPARGMHYPKAADGSDLFSAQNLFLAYHPDVVEAVEPQNAAA